MKISEIWLTIVALLIIYTTAMSFFVVDILLAGKLDIGSMASVWLAVASVSLMFAGYLLDRT